MRYLLPVFMTLALCTSCGKPGPEPAAEAPTSTSETSASDAAAHQAHDAYVTAINSNNLDSLLGMLTDDVVYLAPNDKPYVGKSAVRPWLEGYLAAYKIHWDKPVQEFVVSGDWAFERYSYTSTDTPLDGGGPVVGTGWGLVIYHRDPDGKWRVARDAWGSDQAATTD